MSKFTGWVRFETLKEYLKYYEKSSIRFDSYKNLRAEKGLSVMGRRIPMIQKKHETKPKSL